MKEQRIKVLATITFFLLLLIGMLIMINKHEEILTFTVQSYSGDHEVILVDQNKVLWTLSVENVYDQAYEIGLIIELKRK